MRVLVTSSRNTFALDIIRKLGSTGHTVFASDTYHGVTGSHSRYLAGHTTTASPRFETDQFIADIADYVEKHDIEVIIPTFEEAFYLAARVADLPANVQLFSGRFDKLARLHDKASFKRLVIEADVPVPETIVVGSEAELHEAIETYPKFFARAAFSRGGVGLLTNTGPLAGKMEVADCHPTPEQPWLVQPFVDGPMLCTYSIIVNGKVTAHCTYSVPEQWAHSTGITFLAVDSTETLEYTQRIVNTLDPNFTGQLSFDFVNNDGNLYAIECNPRPTNGVMLLEAEEVERAFFGEIDEPIVVPPGVEKQVTIAVIADAFAQPLSHLKTSLHDIFNVKDIGAGWHDGIAMMWSPATLIHGAKLSHGKRKELLGALGDDIVWNGEEIVGMSETDRESLEEVHAQRV
ncbi:carbamoyl-phosphate synthase large subunit [Leucobacter sp. HY1908]